MKKIILFLLIYQFSHCQSNIVASSHNSYTVGSDLVQLQILVVKEVPLSVPKYEIEQPPKMVVVKKKNFFQKLIEVLIKIFKK